MEEIAISEFKAKCLSLMDRVSKTRKPLRVVRRGEPVVDIIPSITAPTHAELFGSMKGTFEINGDIVTSAADADEWEVLRD